MADLLAGLSNFACPNCGKPVNLVGAVDKPGGPLGITTIDVDLMPMAVHMVGCTGRRKPEVA